MLKFSLIPMARLVVTGHRLIRRRVCHETTYVFEPPLTLPSEVTFPLLVDEFESLVGEALAIIGQRAYDAEPDQRKKADAAEATQRWFLSQLFRHRLVILEFIPDFWLLHTELQRRGVHVVAGEPFILPSGFLDDYSWVKESYEEDWNVPIRLAC